MDAFSLAAQVNILTEAALEGVENMAPYSSSATHHSIAAGILMEAAGRLVGHVASQTGIDVRDDAMGCFQAGFSQYANKRRRHGTFRL